MRQFVREYFSPSMVVLMAMGFLNYMDRYVLSVLIEPIKNDLGFSDTQLGLISGLAFALFYATLGFPLARIADTGSRRKLLAWATAAWSAMTALSGTATSFWHLFLCRVGVGAGEAGGLPPAYSLISDYFPPERRAGALALFTVGTALGSVAGLVLGGVIAHFWGWRAAFVMLGLPGLIVAGLLWVFVHEPPRRGIAADQKPPRFLPTLRGLMQRGTFVHLVIGFGVMSFATYGLDTWTPSFLVRSHGLSTAQAGLYLGLINGLGSVSALLIGGFVSDRLAARDITWQLRLPVLTTLAAVPALLLYYSLPSLGPALVAGFFGQFAAWMYAGPILAAIQGAAGPHARALATAVLMFVTAALGQGLGPVLVGFISDTLTARLGPDALRYALLVLLVLPVWGAGHFWLAIRYFRDDLERPMEASGLRSNG
jgi:predicted MFS family arabinose efflux permease